VYDLDFGLSKSSCLKVIIGKIQNTDIVSPKPQLMHGDGVGTGTTVRKSAVVGWGRGNSMVGD